MSTIGQIQTTIAELEKQGKTINAPVDRKALACFSLRFLAERVPTELLQDLDEAVRAHQSEQWEYLNEGKS